MPHGSTASIKAYLREGDIEVRQFDFNIEIYDRMLTPEVLSQLWKQTPWDKDLPAPTPGAPGRTRVGAMLARRVDEIIAGIEESVSVLKTLDKFYDPDSYRKAVATVDAAILLISASSWELDEALKNPATALAAAKDPSVNVYLPYIEEQIDKLATKKPEMLGLNVIWPRQMIPAISIALMAKEKLPGLHVSIGGDYPTFIEHVLMETPEMFEAFDSVILSEGEVASLALAKSVEKGGGPSEVPGILYLSEGKVVKTSLPVMEDADELPIPDYDQLPLKKYLSPEPVLPIFSSRGCYWRKCTFCMRADRRTFSQRSPQQVVKDITSLSRRYKARAFHFTDNAIRPRRMAEIADGITEAGLEILWTAKTRISPEMTWDWCDQIATGGCARIVFKLESASKKVLNSMEQGFRIEDVPEKLQGLSKAGIDATLHFMVGYPGENAEDARKTIQFVERLKDTVTPYAQYYATLFGIAHGSPIYADLKKFGVKKVEERDPKDMRNPYYYDFDASGGMSREEAVKGYGEMSALFEKLMSESVRMPHDMLMRFSESQDLPGKNRTVKMLQIASTPRLADDIRAAKGYLLKGKKKFRIDETMRAFIDFMDSGKTVKQIMSELGKQLDISTSATFIFIQQLYEEGIIETDEVEKKSNPTGKKG